MWSVRMRAAKTAIGYQLSAISKKQKRIHISGAEGLFEEKDIPKSVNEYIKRALNHLRGKPDEIVITIEKIKESPKKISLLPVSTLKCSSPLEAERIISQRLYDAGISEKAINNAFKVLTSEETMRGASLMLAGSGVRIEPDKKRGVRVSRFGIEKSALRKLTQRLSRMGINTITVREALALASKAASCPDIIAEVCISDDPDYTTGYIASRKFGYLRIPNIKKYGEMHGGRVLFVSENADIEMMIDYLEKKPVTICYNCIVFYEERRQTTISNS
jgi:6-carboxyhexanoate--CoA ligase